MAPDVHLELTQLNIGLSSHPREPALMVLVLMLPVYTGASPECLKVKMLVWMVVINHEASDWQRSRFKTMTGARLGEAWA